ncbi:MAG: hypothetical protein ACRELY_20085, partial [Polyangiaceae bacterium]
MKRILLAAAVFLGMPFGCMVGCNAILGNELGDVTMTDASVGEQSESCGGGSDCGPGTKDCEGVCVDIGDPSNGCAGSCSAC